MRTLKVLLVILVLQACLFSQENRQISYGSIDDSEIWITVNPDNNDILLATWNNYNYEMVKPGYNFSFDGGDSWPDTYINEEDYIHHPYLSHSQHGPNNYGFDPSCGFDLSGRTYYCFITSPWYYNPPEPTYERFFGSVIMAYTDNYEDWQFTEIHEGTGSPEVGTGDDKCLMAIDTTTSPNYIYVAWTDRSSGSSRSIKFMRSIDRGQSFDDLQDLHTINGQGSFLSTSLAPVREEFFVEERSGPLIQGPMPVIDPTTGDLYVFWSNLWDDAGGVDLRVYYRKSTDKGENFGPLTYINHWTGRGLWNSGIGSLHSPSIPSVAICPINGNIYIAIPV